jgi:CheY-like chemotaxis protein
LVVEASDDSREVLRAAMEYCGALVTTAASVEEATRILSTLRPHILVTDIGMPNDGLELVREVARAARAWGVGSIPAIAITAYRARRDEILAEGFVELIEKPLNPLALCGVIRCHAQVQTPRKSPKGQPLESASSPSGRRHLVSTSRDWPSM